MDNTAANQTFQPETREYLEQTPIGARKQRGQYFTPEPTRQRLLEQIPPLSQPAVLDPAAGTGEFLLSAENHFDEPELEGWEIDPELVKRANTIVPDANLEEKNSLQMPFQARFDVVIGNPPYFEFQPEPEIRKCYEDILFGRVNICGLFVKLGLEGLKPGGWLGFVISSSMANGAYFSKLREYIIEQSDIRHIEILEDQQLFQGAQQSVMLLVLQKTNNTGQHVFRKNGTMIFSEQAQQLEKSFAEKTTLAEIGWDVKTGGVVWNQHRDKLTDDPEEGVPLIWSSNLSNQGLVLPHDRDRPQYINWDNPRTGPAIVVNRVTGAGSNARLRATLIEEEMEFVAENHTNVIIPTDEAEDKPGIEHVLRELRKEENTKTIQSITGNTQFSRTELKNFFPLGLPEE